MSISSAAVYASAGVLFVGVFLGGFSAGQAAGPMDQFVDLCGAGCGPRTGPARADAFAGSRQEVTRVLSDEVSAQMPAPVVLGTDVELIGGKVHLGVKTHGKRQATTITPQGEKASETGGATARLANGLNETNQQFCPTSATIPIAGFDVSTFGP